MKSYQFRKVDRFHLGTIANKREKRKSQAVPFFDIAHSENQEPMQSAFFAPTSYYQEEQGAANFFQPSVQKKKNNTGLPDNLKEGVEKLSGISLEDVSVHYDSDKPAQVQALAYTQGTDVHVGPAQEKHLPHEAWHVVQQKQGRVQPTTQTNGGVFLNDDKGLENEAEVMSAKARSSGYIQTNLEPVYSSSSLIQRNAFLTSIANATSQIDYTVISVAATNTNEHQLYIGISNTVERNRKRQAVLQALHDANLANQVTNYVNANWQGHMGALAATNLDIRSSHSGGGIDPLLPQPAYEAVPVPNVSVAIPNLVTLGDRANYSHLESSTTEHTTDPDHPKFRGGPGQPPLLGGAQRLQASLNRVASYFEFHADSIYDLHGDKAVNGTRLVYDPFSRRYFLSEHYARQYELINVPHFSLHNEYQNLLNNLNLFMAQPAYQNANPAEKDQLLQKVIGKILSKINRGEY